MQFSESEQRELAQVSGLEASILPRKKTNELQIAVDSSWRLRMQRPVFNKPFMPWPIRAG